MNTKASTQDIRANIERVRSRMYDAAVRASRKPEEIRLLAVTKTVSDQRLVDAIDAGQRLFGENYVQEAQAKIASAKEVAPDIIWHFIGHLQTNKAKLAVSLFECIQTLDSVKLARAIDKYAEKQDKVMPCMIQINISGEDSKFGLSPDALQGFLDDISCFEHIRIIGLMAVPFWTPEPEGARPYFKALRDLRDANQSHKVAHDMNELSMGMTNDFEVAIEEGATIVRVGTAIFGPRPQSCHLKGHGV